MIIKRFISKFFLLILVSLISCSLHENRKNDFDKLKKQAKENYEKDNFLEAYKDYDKLIKMDSTNGEFYFNKGFSEMGLMKYDDSRNDFFHAIALYYRKASSYYNIGLTYLYDNDSLAAYYFETCLKFDPNHEKAKFFLNDLKTKEKAK